MQIQLDIAACNAERDQEIEDLFYTPKPITDEDRAMADEVGQEKLYIKQS